MTDLGFLDNISSENAVLEAAAFAIAISRGKNADQIAVLSAFLTLVGDGLAMIGAKMSISAPENNGKTGDRTESS